MSERLKIIEALKNAAKDLEKVDKHGWPTMKDWEEFYKRRAEAIEHFGALPPGEYIIGSGENAIIWTKEAEG